MTVNQEQPPVPHEQQPQQAEGTSSNTAPTKPPSQLLRELLVQNKELEDLQNELQKNGTIEKNEKLQRTTHKMKEDLRTILDHIQNPKPGSERIRMPPVALDIFKAKSMNRSDITEESAPVIYEFLRLVQPVAQGGLGNNLSNHDEILDACKAMLKIAKFEPFTTTEILKKLQVHALTVGCTQEELRDVDRFVNPVAYRREFEESTRADRREYDEVRNRALNPINGVSLGERVANNIRITQRALCATSLASGVMSEQQFEELVNAYIESETYKMRGELTTALNELISSYGSRNETISSAKYDGLISKLRSEGRISDADAQMLLLLKENPDMMKIIEKQQIKSEGEDLVYEATRVFVPSEQQVKLLRAISSSRSLKEFLQTEKGEKGLGLKYMIGTNPSDKNIGTINWDAFTKDIKGIFGELLSIADRNPNQFFDQAFNPMYEGHLYQQLLQRVAHLGSQVSMSIKNGDEFFSRGDKMIGIQEPISTPSPNTKEAPYKQEVQTKTTRHNLADAIGKILHNDMNDYKYMREHLHNINAICTQGLGWEQLKQYSERFEFARLDTLMRQEKDLSIAYNFYSDALQKEIARNGKVIQTDFGKNDTKYKLNGVERKALYSLKSYLKEKTEYKGLDDDALTREAIQKIRMASAISYGLTGEFWSTLLTSRLPIGTEKVVNSVGETVDHITEPFTGSSHRGYEKMIVEIDIDMSFQRWNIPRFYNAFRYTQRCSDMQHPAGAWSKEGFFDHQSNYKNRELIEDARINGRSDELIDKDEWNVYLTDFLRTKCVGLFSRGGWRFANWTTCIEYNDPKTRDRVDYVKTLAKVRQMGSYLTKRFIDELKPAQIEAMTREEINTFIGIDKTWGQLSKDEREMFKDKEFLYTRLLFGQIARVSPTKFLQLEDKRWTPRGEEMLRKDLCNYLNGQVKKYYSSEVINYHIYDMYVTALTLAEKNTWMGKRKYTQDYVFGPKDIDDSTNQLRTFFETYKKDEIGEFSSHGQNIKIEEDFDEFLKNLKGFQGALRSSIDTQRYHNEDGKGARESLQKRFAHMLTKGGNTVDSQGYIETLIAGDDFDAENFYFGAAGGYGSTRFMTETFNITSKMNPALGKIFFDVLPEFTKSQFKDVHEVEKFFHEKLLPQFKEIHGAISNMDKDQADEFCISLALFVSNIIGKDRILRIKGIGPVVGWWKRQRYGTQSSVMQDFFPESLKKPSHSADSDEIYAMANTIIRGLNIPEKEKIIDHMETTFSLFGRPIISKPVYKNDKKISANGEMLEKALGLKGATPWFETYLPVAGAAVFLILLAMAYLANQKNKKK